MLDMEREKNSQS